MDMNCSGKPISEELGRNEINFSVVGPSRSGKTALLKTMHYALNGTPNTPIEAFQLDKMSVKRI